MIQRTVARVLWAVVLVLVAPARAADLPTEIDADRLARVQTGGNVLLANATVHPVSGPVLPSTSILVADGRIARLLDAEEAASFVPPQDLAVIDCAGLHVTPGIIDCHSHIAIAGGVNESGSSITAEVRIADEVNGDDLAIYRALAGGCTTANLLHGSANPIGGQNAVIKLKYRRPAEELLFRGAPRGIKFALGENPKQSNGSRRGPGRYPSTRMGVEAVLRRGLTEAQEYARAHAAAAAAGATAVPPRRDLRLETLAGVLRGDVLVHAHCYRNDEILMLLRLAEEFGFRVATLQHVLEGYKVAPEIAAHGAGASTFSDWWAYKAEAYDAIPYNAALMHRAGVLVSLNSDSSELMRRLNLEAAKVVRYGGVDPRAALAMVTLNPARQLGIDHRVGSVEVGKDADLAVWNGDPLAGSSRCEWTLVDGEVEFQRAGHPTALDAPITEPEPAVEGATTALDTAPIVRELRLPPPPRGRYAITGARIEPVRGDVIEGGTLLMAEGRIEALGRDLAVPPGYQVIDGHGLHVYPGMIDPATSLGLTEVGSVPGTVDTREQGALQADLRVAVAINPASEHLPVARAAGVTTAVVRPQGSLISGQSALVHLDGWTAEDMALVDPLALHVDPPGWGGGRRGRGRRARVEPPVEDSKEDPRTAQLLDAFVDARAYAELRERASAAAAPVPPWDPVLEALLPYARGERPVIFDADDEKAIRKVIELAGRLRVRPIVAGGREAWKVAGLLARHDVPVLLGPVLTNPTEAHDPYDAPFANAAVLHRAGVRFAFQTGDSSAVRNLPHHAAMAAAFGLPREAALAAVTIGAAEILGVAADLGSLEPGKVADVVVTDGDLLDLRTRVLHVFVHGRPASLETKHTRLWERYLERLAPAGGAARAGARVEAPVGGR